MIFSKLLNYQYTELQSLILLTPQKFNICPSSNPSGTRTIFALPRSISSRRSTAAAAAFWTSFEPTLHRRSIHHRCIHIYERVSLPPAILSAWLHKRNADKERAVLCIACEMKFSRGYVRLLWFSEGRKGFVDNESYVFGRICSITYEASKFLKSFREKEV